MKHLTEDIPIRTGATAVYPYSPKLEELFTIFPKFSPPYSLATKIGNCLHVPRECVPLGKEDHRVSFEPSAINCKTSPRNDDQAQVIENSYLLLTGGENHVLEAPTGFGKSYCGAAIACKVGQPTIIVVTKEDLVKSWRDTLVNHVGIPASQIGHIQGDVCKYKGCRFVIAMVHSLVIADKYPSELFSYFGMVIFDEVHRMAADTFSKASMLFPALYRLGLSATPDRSDGKWKVVEYNIGKVRVKGVTVPMKPKVLVQLTGWKIPMVSRNVQGMMVQRKLEHQPGRMAKVWNAMGASHERNAIASEFVVAALKQGRNTLVLADHIDAQLVPLFASLSLHGVPAESIGYYIGGKTELQLSQAAKKPVVLATYKMCSEGTDKPWWDTLVLLNPRTDVKQSIGRVMRYVEGKKTPVVLDLLDFDPLFTTFYNKREKQYYEVGATIVKM